MFAISTNKTEVCKLCGGNFDFRKVQITECLGEIGITLTGNLHRINEENKFKFCPECGRKLTDDDFKCNTPHTI